MKFAEVAQDKASVQGLCGDHVEHSIIENLFKNSLRMNYSRNSYTR
jgi:hypothetical protein